MLQSLLVPIIAVAGLGATPDPSRVVGGTDAGVCDFPADVWIGNQGGFNCTASLVHPRVLITAAHCLGNVSVAGFGESAFNSQLTVGVQNCQPHPDYAFGGPDLAFCVLGEDAPDVAMVPVIMGCEVDEIQPGGEIVIAGFGQSDEASGSGGGIKRYTSNSVDSMDVPDGKLYLLGNNNGSCFGDSGGPSFIQLSDGSWRVVAAVQGPHPQAPPLGCGYGGTYTLIHPYMEWIEQNAGHDITPCFDADGTWNPDERCGGFPTQIQGGGGQWSNLCDGPPASGPGETCGPPSGEVEPDPPETETDGETDGDTDGDTSLPPDTAGDDGGGTTGDEPEPEDDDPPQDEDDAEDDDDPPEDEDEDEEASDPALPSQYGHGATTSTCQVSAGSGGPLRVLGVGAMFGLLGMMRRRRTRSSRREDR